LSTKIYNAYRFDGSLDDLMKHLQEFREKWLKMWEDALFEKMKELPSPDQRMEFWSKVEKDTRKEFNRWGDLDIKANCVIYPHKGNLYVQFFVDLEPFRISKPLFVDEDVRFVDYHYQDQTDPWYDNEGLEGEELEKAERDWEERKIVWNQIFDENWTPSSTGLSYAFGNSYDLYLLKSKIFSRLRELKNDREIENVQHSN
jgi:hypothetical protein